MSWTTADDLFDLLPAFYRERDEQSGGALRGLLEVIARELSVVELALDELEDDQFVETASADAVAGIGEVIGYVPLPAADSRVSPRADLANTIHYRRRKGTPLLLERLTRDVTGWSATVEESFARLAWTQYARHVRAGAGGTASARDALSAGTPFDRLPVVPDARRVTASANGLRTELPVGGPGAPRPGIPTVAVRLFPDHPVAQDALLSPVAGHPRRFRVDLLGRDRALYQRIRPVGQDTPVVPLDLPLPLTRHTLHTHHEDLTGPHASLAVHLADRTIVAPERLVVRDLGDTPTGWGTEPSPGMIAVDPERGRIVLGADIDSPRLRVTSYDARSQAAGAGAGRDRAVDPATPHVFDTDDLNGDLDGVLATVSAAPPERDPGEITVLVKGDRRVPISTIHGVADRTLSVVGAADTRPVLVAAGPLPIATVADAVVSIEGVVFVGGPVVVPEREDDRASELRLSDCTLVPGVDVAPDGSPTLPGTASLVVLHPFARIVLSRCIVGPIVAVEGAEITLIDCMVDAGEKTAIAYTGRATAAPGTLRTVTTLAEARVEESPAPGAALTVQGSTIIGRVHARALEASDTLFDGRLDGRLDAGDAAPSALWVRRRQEGCVRFCLLPPGARVPRRFRCLDGADLRMTPQYWSRTFDHPRYGLLHPATAFQIRRGAADGGEIGVSGHLHITHVETNLTARLQEYLRFGLEAGFSYAEPHDTNRERA